jgi:hypothetical protein
MKPKYGNGKTIDKRCSICYGPLEPDLEKRKFWDDGNNAWPVNNGRCCDRCNHEVVIPTRMGRPKGSLGTWEEAKVQQQKARELLKKEQGE